MKVRIIWVGRTKERHTAEAIKLYLAKLRPFAEMEVAEIKERKGIPAGAALLEEGRRILKRTSSFVLFDERGRKMTSPQFASYLDDRSKVNFVLGGSYGVSEEVRGAASDMIALSSMTLTHEMARLVALEQIYRAMMINTGRGYHH